MEKSKSGRSARWGAACAPCATAKARCIRMQSPGMQSSGLQCERCRSMGRHCSDQTPGPRKKRQAKPSANSDTITALPGERVPGVIYSPGTPSREVSTARAHLTNSSHDYLANTYSASSVGTERPAPDLLSQEETALNTPTYTVVSNAPGRPSCSCMAPVDKDDLVPVESDEALLSIYKNQLSSRLPFVTIPAGITPRQLQENRPFLWKVIRMVASVRHLRLLRGQSRAVMEHISNAMLIRSERSLDLLQGILVFLGSYHYHCMIHAQFNNLIHLAIGLVEDMDLNRCPKPQLRSQLPLARAENPSARTNEERRALLGVWYMSSNAGFVVKHFAAPKYTKYLDQCLTELEHTREYKTDQLAVQLVRLQRLTEKIFHFHSEEALADEVPYPPEAAMTARLEDLQMELNEFRNVLPLDLRSDDLLACYYHSACMRIYEPLLAGSHLPDTKSQSFASLTLSGVLISDVFARFTAALKAWFASWVAIPVCSYFHMPQPAYAHLVHAAMMLSRWIRVAGPGAVKPSSTSTAQKDFTNGWQPIPAFSGVPPCPDLSLPRHSASGSAQVESAQVLNGLRAQVVAQPDLQVDIFGMLDTMIGRFEAAKKEMKAAQGLDWENDTWDFAAEHMRRKRNRIEKWCEIVNKAAGVGRTDACHGVFEEAGETANMEERNVNGFEWLTAGYEYDNLHWESAIFDEIMRDIHSGAGFDSSVDRNLALLEDLESLGGSNIEADGQH